MFELYPPIRRKFVASTNQVPLKDLPFFKGKFVALISAGLQFIMIFPQ